MTLSEHSARASFKWTTAPERCGCTARTTAYQVTEPKCRLRASLSRDSILAGARLPRSCAKRRLGIDGGLFWPYGISAGLGNRSPVFVCRRAIARQQTVSIGGGRHGWCRRGLRSWGILVRPGHLHQAFVTRLVPRDAKLVNFGFLVLDILGKPLLIRKKFINQLDELELTFSQPPFGEIDLVVGKIGRTRQGQGDANQAERHIFARRGGRRFDCRWNRRRRVRWNVHGGQGNARQRVLCAQNW